MKEKERSANDKRSDVSNSNNLEYQKDKDNTSKQLIREKDIDRLADMMIDRPELFVGNDE